MTAYQRMLRISWKDHRTNQSILELDTNTRLLNDIVKKTLVLWACGESRQSLHHHPSQSYCRHKEMWKTTKTLFQGAKVPRNFRSWERKFPVGNFAPRSENTGQRKVPEPLRQLPAPGDYYGISSLSLSRYEMKRRIWMSFANTVVLT